MCAVIRPLASSCSPRVAALTLAACGDDSTATAPAPAVAAAAPPAGRASDRCAAADGSAAKPTVHRSAPDVHRGRQAYVAVIETNQGTLHVQLRNDIAPNTVNSFVNLARYHYFDGTTCHRAIRNFVVQCGDPTATGRAAPATSSPTSSTRSSRTRSVPWPWPTPARTPTAASSSSSPATTARPAPELHAVRSGHRRRPGRRRRARRRWRNPRRRPAAAAHRHRQVVSIDEK